MKNQMNKIYAEMRKSQRIISERYEREHMQLMRACGRAIEHTRGVSA